MVFFFKSDKASVTRFFNTALWSGDARDEHSSYGLKHLLELNIAEVEWNIFDENTFLPQILVIGLELGASSVFMALNDSVEDSMLLRQDFISCVFILAD